MGTDKPELSKEERISKEYKKLKKIFKELPKRDQAVIEGLISNVAFMKITLDDLQAEIKKNGEVEEYQNGENQHGRKESAELKAYNTMIKNYTAAIKVLVVELEKLPAEMKTSKLEALLNG